ncbi:MAG TPA: hypothetical protein DHW42_10255 [Candidatus Marinimicrobia bacterium]|nr:hypothetical protein [Candidatus Neomarinimicrobiota bacterium]
MKDISKRYHNFHKEQYWYAGHFVEDFLGIPNHNSLKILEVGTAEGGLLKYFSEKGHYCYGIEYSESRYEFSKALNKDSKIKFIHGDITDQSTYADYLQERMNIVICRDVIEHIHPNKKIIALKNMAAILNPDGKLFISFPPKYSPYAGHQQGAPKIFAKLPYLHLLPAKIFRSYLSMLNIPQNTINQLNDIRKSRISIDSFEEMLPEAGFKIKKHEFYFIRPCFEYRFKIKKMKNPFRYSPLREIFSLGAIYALTK